MKSLFFAFAMLSAIFATAQTVSLEKVWETDAKLAVPESVLPQDDYLFISLIDGPSWEADKKGGIGKLSPKGKIIDTTWITGLSAPKGMARVGDRLYVADITTVVVIDIKSKKIIKKIAVEPVVALNDVTATDDGVVYVSDSRLGNVWKIEKDVPTLYMQELPNVNGLKAIKDELYIGSGKSFFRSTGPKERIEIAEVPQNIDGIEPVGNGDFLVSSWMGYLYYVTKDGKVETLLDFTAEKKNIADIGYDPAERMLYIPTFNGKTVAAYRLK